MLCVENESVCTRERDEKFYHLRPSPCEPLQQQHLRLRLLQQPRNEAFSSNLHFFMKAKILFRESLEPKKSIPLAEGNVPLSLSPPSLSPRRSVEIEGGGVGSVCCLRGRAASPCPHPSPAATVPVVVVAARGKTFSTFLTERTKQQQQKTSI